MNVSSTDIEGVEVFDYVIERLFKIRLWIIYTGSKTSGVTQKRNPSGRSRTSSLYRSQHIDPFRSSDPFEGSLSISLICADRSLVF